MNQATSRISYNTVGHYNLIILIMYPDHFVFSVISLVRNIVAHISFPNLQYCTTGNYGLIILVLAIYAVYVIVLNAWFTCS